VSRLSSVSQHAQEHSAIVSVTLYLFPLFEVEVVVERKPTSTCGRRFENARDPRVVASAMLTSPTSAAAPSAMSASMLFVFICKLLLHFIIRI